jgi:hypothetical protein
VYSPLFNCLNLKTLKNFKPLYFIFRGRKLTFTDEFSVVQFEFIVDEKASISRVTPNEADGKQNSFQIITNGERYFLLNLIFYSLFYSYFLSFVFLAVIINI